jgi:hypothetical protein
VKTGFSSVILLIGLVLAAIGTASASGTAASTPAAVQATPVGGGFTYQGELKNASGPVNATCVFQFARYDAASGGAPIGAPLSQNIQVAGGLFTAQLDFGAGAFSGQSQWLQVAVKCPGDTSFTVLTPRQQLTAVPYALSLMPGATISGPASVALTIENTTFASQMGTTAIDPMSAAALIGRARDTALGGESTGGIGVLGRSPSVVGVQGESTTGTGVLGRSPSAVGVLGASTNSVGVYGQSDNEAGVVGISTSSDGVRGASTNSIGVYGYSPNGWAGWFEGNVHVNGTLSKAAGSFKIDHPLDPTNKYLSHSFVESPDMKNIYDGVATTDANGEAVVELPSYFEALNRDFRYQLTVIGQFAQAMIASEIAANHFTIKTDKPNVRVSWQVTGIRQDAFANAHRIVVEEDKPPAERGTYLHPTELGQPESEGLGYQRQQTMRSDLQSAASQPSSTSITKGR